MNQLRRRLAPEVAEPDRTYLAMAAYNVGMGHLNDARILAAEEGGDPNAWEDVMQQLPKLQKPVYYRKARRIRMRRLPYSVIYRVYADVIVVVACLHGRLDPRKWRSRADG